MNSPFVAAVYAAARRIPPGKVATYGQLAALAGQPRAARAVGRAMSHCPEGSDIPCHRVIRHDGSLCDAWAFMIPGIQRALLLSEGVAFLADGRVNMKACQWQPNSADIPQTT